MRAMVERVSPTASEPPKTAVNAQQTPGPPRRRPVPRHPGIYLPAARPRQDRVALRVPLPRLNGETSVGGRPWQPRRHRDSPGRATLAPQPRRAHRTMPADLRAVRQRVAGTANTTATHDRDLHLGLTQHLIPSFGPRRLDEIHVEDIADARISRAGQPPARCARSRSSSPKPTAKVGSR
jgi:hypothetical protein